GPGCGARDSRPVTRCSVATSRAATTCMSASSSSGSMRAFQELEGAVAHQGVRGCAFGAFVGVAIGVVLVIVRRSVIVRGGRCRRLHFARLGRRQAGTVEQGELCGALLDDFFVVEALLGAFHLER